jgi:hypothetical protein
MYTHKHLLDLRHKRRLEDKELSAAVGTDALGTLTIRRRVIGPEEIRWQKF